MPLRMPSKAVVMQQASFLGIEHLKTEWCKSHRKKKSNNLQNYYSPNSVI